MSPGVPDLLLCDEQGSFHFIELKATTSNSVRLSAHQVAWLKNHYDTSSWILVKQQKPQEQKHVLFLYQAEEAINLQKKGLKHFPHGRFESPVSWDLIFSLISPINSDIILGTLVK